MPGSAELHEQLANPAFFFLELGELAAKKIGTSYRIKRSVLEAYLSR